MSEDKRERISHRAFELWQADGAEHGRDWEYWLRAEAEIDAEDAAAPAKPKRKRAAPKADTSESAPAGGEAAEPAPAKKATRAKSSASKSSGTKSSTAKSTTRTRKTTT
ncbi:DUF2934 domain-containing protein [Roseospirillum parvum]|uniref:DUF2934 domain-containing protein n=1 Tax=Roseospirillum parvum TaxID=83401 RepID=A0A1G7U0B5_9PROT|nr:DUF2934 domain-containing protein [Roseospirillum parvum]SDG40509.1 Protein of unknown function [Roseospirillum parvum]